MSLARFVYYSAIIGGWAAFAAWLVTELLGLGRSGSAWLVPVIAAALGAAIAAGLNAVAVLAGGSWKQLPARVALGLIGGAIGGLVGGGLGQLLYSAVEFPGSRVVGWTMMGLCIGVVYGASEQSAKKLRNGMIGGTLGGLIGGFLFDALPYVIPVGSDISSRATCFVVLGLSVGALIGLAQVLLKDAWVTVVDGFRPGRQLILTQPVTVMGRADHLPLYFSGPMNTGLAPEHVRISREADAFTVEDLRTETGTFLNGARLNGKARLKDGDVIKFGPNHLRFNERARRNNEEAPVPAAAPVYKNISAPPPPPIAARPAAPPAPAPQPARAPAAAAPQPMPAPAPMAPVPAATSAPPRPMPAAPGPYQASGASGVKAPPPPPPIRSAMPAPPAPAGRPAPIPSGPPASAPAASVPPAPPPPANRPTVPPPPPPIMPPKKP